MQDRTDHNRLAAQLNERISADPGFVDTRVRELNTFERRANGEAPHGRKGPRSTPRPAPKSDGVIAVADPQTMSATIDLTARAPSSLLDIIMVAGSDPAFDVEKFKSLVAIQREEQDRADARAERQAELAAEAAFDAALSEAQGKISRIVTNQYNTQTRSNYADYAALDRVIRPIYVASGFSLSFDEEDSPKADHIRVVSWVTHVATGAKRSHKRKYHADIPADGKGARGGDVMTKTHATGSAFTYGKRYVASNIFNIAIGKDDDGNSAAGKAAAAAEAPVAPGTISPAQAEIIRSALAHNQIAERAFLQFIRLARIEDIGSEHFERALAKIKSFRRQS